MRNLSVILLMYVLLGAGCTRNLDPQRRTISLSATLGDVVIESSVQTKAGNVNAVPYAGNPAQNNALNTALWFSYTPGSYSHSPEPPQYLPCVTTASFVSSAPTEIKIGENSLLYPVQADSNYEPEKTNVYCVGFSPADGWGGPTDPTSVLSASHAINGSQDLMFADQIVGSSSQNFGKQRFNHLLTWVKINLSATYVGAAGVWGDVEKLTVVSPENSVKVSFAQRLEDGTIPASNVLYEGVEEDFALTLIPSDKSLNLTTKTFGQAFCAPPAYAEIDETNRYKYVDPTTENVQLGYIVRVKTAKSEEKEVFVRLIQEHNVTPVTDRSSAAGKLFVINLYFNEAAVIEGVCTLKQWEDLDSEIYFNSENTSDDENVI